MPATIATRDNDAVLGPRKDQLGGPGPRTKTINADEWNRVVDLLFAMQAEIGDTDGTTVGSLWEAAGGGASGFTYVAVTADATLPSANAIVDVDTTGLTAPDTLELTLPAASAGRVYIIRKTAGAANETITLKRAASEQIDGVGANRLLPGSDNLVDAIGHSTPHAVWTVYCDGTNWRSYQASPETRAVWGKSGAPVDSVDTVAGYDYIPGSTWHGGGSPGHLWIQTGVDAGDAKWRRIDAPGLRFELDTTDADATDLSATTEVQGKTTPGGSAFAGTVTVAGNIAAPWDSDTKMLTVTTSALMTGLGLRQVECGDLPSDGFIVDVGLGDLDGSLVSTMLVIAMYEQRAGTNGRGVGIGIQQGSAQLNVVGFADDGADSPAVNTSPVTFMSADSWPSAPSTFNRGPWRAIIEVRKVDASSPERWTMRVTCIGIGGVTSQTYSGIAYPATGWSTSLDLAGASMTRVGIGAWCTAAEGGDMSISHLRIYELGSAIPT